jgi:hypothetical protein
MDEDSEVRFEGRIDIGSSNGPWMKMISSMCNQKEWTMYIRVVMKLEIHGIELVMKVLGYRLCRKRLMRRVLNVVLCLRNHRKKLRMTLMQMSPPLLAVMK